jgi:glycosyltransferase involved in cell wall biosynthesis
MEKPFISFVIAYYDLPLRLLRQCLDSILALSLQPSEREIIVVDDGSEHSPMNELMAYGDAIHYIRQAHQGLSVARNTGLQMASGTYLQFVDSDDILLKKAYEHCIDLARKHQTEMVVFQLTRQNDSKDTYKDSEAQSGSNYMRHQNIRGSACGYLFARSILGDLRFTPGIRHEDEEFTPQLLLRAEIIRVTDAKAYLYRHTPDSITTSKDSHQRLSRLEDSRNIIERLNTIADRLPRDDRMALQRRVAQLTMDYLYNIIRQTGSRQHLEREMEVLRKQGLFPLPDRDYTQKYTWFRRLTNSSIGISILMRLCARF